MPAAFLDVDRSDLQGAFMNMQRLISRSIPLTTALLMAAAPTLSAQWDRDRSSDPQGRRLFDWTGRVDREIQIVMRGDNVWTRDVRGNENERSRTRTAGELPRRDGQVTVRLTDGRGDVDVIQQPSSRNSYTTVVRIRDRSSGADRYRLSAYWQATDDGYGRGNHGGYGRGNGDGIPSRDRDDRGGWGNGRGNDDGYGSRTALRWTGSVDGELEIRLQGGRVEYRTLSGNQVRNVRADVAQGIPRRATELVLSRSSGRGNVYIVQQPSERNGYSAVIRVRDPQGGYGNYDFELSWR
jgi:hypothetical protein